jgi:hypothetical protein
MEKFTEIDQFRQVVKTVQMHYDHIGSPHLVPTLTFVGTPKLHGTNGGIRRKNGKIHCQSRNELIDVTHDNCGFAKFISEIPVEVINGLFDYFSTNPNDDVTIFGEFAGKGIQDTVAIVELPKFWALFNAKVNGEYVTNIERLRAPAFRIFNVNDGPRYEVKVDFKNPSLSLPEFERLTLAVEDECPFGKLHGVSGIGEGIVWICKERPTDSDLFFKTKGTKHSKSKARKVATVDIEKVKGIIACVDLVLSEGRLNQGFDHLREKGIALDVKNLGLYLKWIANDIVKEESDTLAGNGFEWKDISKEVNTRGREHFFKKLDKSVGLS